MGGRVGLESEPGRGSTFWVELGLEKQKAPEARRAPAPATLAGLRVLVVDDYDVNRRIYCEHLRAWGCVADEAASGRAALDALRRAADLDPYGLVLLDMHMPEMDGEATAAAIRAEPRLAELPLILLSSVGAHPSAAWAQARGFVATLTKPVRRAHLLEVVGSASAGAARRAAPAPPHGPRPGLGLRVLLAEDNPINQKVALEMLRRLGCRVEAVDNGAQVIAAIERSFYDVVLMDVQMPEMDGFEATAHIRRREAQTGNHLPIIAITAHAMEGDRERCLAAGMDAYLSKPMKTEQLAEALRPYSTQAARAGGHSGLSAHV
jgi:CheY-like chemotaxis protein